MSSTTTGGMDDWEDDPIVRGAVDDAVAPYAGMVSPAYLRAMREALADHLLMHPATDLLIRGLRDRAPVQKSGEEPMEPAGRDTADAPGGTLKKVTRRGA